MPPLPVPSRLPAVLRTLDLYQLEVLANKWAIEQSQQSRGSSFNGVKVAVIVAGVVAGNSERRLGGGQRAFRAPLALHAPHERGLSIRVAAKRQRSQY